MLSERTSAPAPAARSSPVAEREPERCRYRAERDDPDDVVERHREVDPVEQEQQCRRQEERGAEADERILQRPLRPSPLEADVLGEREVQSERHDEQSEDDEGAQRRAVQPDLLRVDEREAEDHPAGDPTHEIGPRRRSLCRWHAATGAYPNRSRGDT
jgi:hypothetical protein